ncbi:hypothetical protein GYA25_01210 [Candidatus Woesearchaeota archaeon]|jgi:hypothetical protein|nr:hypothetical protein [Candidatus Woesearchaeota archaeon]
MVISNITNKIKRIFSKPSKFFEDLNKEEGVGESFKFYAILFLFYTLLYYGVLFLFKNSEKFFLFSIPLSYGLGLGLSFVGAAILHVWILIFGGKEKYSKTYQLSVYSSLPSLLFGWFPIIGHLVGSIYSICLLIIGTQKVYKIPKIKTLWMYVFIPLIILLVLIILIAVLFGISLIGYYSKFIF